MASISDSEIVPNSSSDTASGVNYNKEDTLLGITNKKVILENSLLAGGDVNLDLIKNRKTGEDLANNSSQDFILNESSSDVPKTENAEDNVDKEDFSIVIENGKFICDYWKLPNIH